GAVIVGCNPLSILVARLLQERGEAVVMIDTDPEASKQAQAENLRVLTSSALDANVLEEAGLALMGTFLAMTKNGEVNFVLAQRAAEEFNPPRVLAVFPRDPQATNGTNNTKVSQAFIPDLQIKTWNQYLKDEQVKLGMTTLKEPGFSLQKVQLQALIRTGELVPLFLERDEKLQIMPAGEAWQSGDRIIYLLHDPRPKLLKRLSGGRDSNRLSLEKLPEVEEIPIAKLSQLSASDAPAS
ncbi:MAG: sodium:proton antiporter, partial [Mastigocladus sp. ERB_26_1]